MSRPITEICSDIEAFTPIDDEWLPLDDLIAEALDHSDAATAFPHLLNVFARFPDDDGAGVFGSIIHGLETFPNSSGQTIETSLAPHQKASCNPYFEFDFGTRIVQASDEIGPAQ